MSRRITQAVFCFEDATTWAMINGFLTAVGTTGISNYQLIDSLGMLSLDWNTRIMYDLLGVPSADYAVRQLYDSGNTNSIDWENRVLYDQSGTPSVDYGLRTLEAFGGTTVDYGGGLLRDISTQSSVDWANRNLIGSDGATTIKNWSDNGVQPSSPATGATITCTPAAYDQTLYITPAATIAALTIALPTNVSSIVGQTVSCFSTQIVTTLTVSQAGGGGTIVGAPAAFTANGSFQMRKVAANTWICISAS